MRTQMGHTHANANGSNPYARKWVKPRRTQMVKPRCMQMGQTHAHANGSNPCARIWDTPMRTQTGHTHARGSCLIAQRVRPFSLFPSTFSPSLQLHRHKVETKPKQIKIPSILYIVAIFHHHHPHTSFSSLFTAAIFHKVKVS